MIDDKFLQTNDFSNNIVELDVSIRQRYVPKADPEQVTSLSLLHRFDSMDWDSVTYADIQKKCTAFPEFIDLKVDEELRFLEDQFAHISNSKWKDARPPYQMPV